MSVGHDSKRRISTLVVSAWLGVAAVGCAENAEITEGNPAPPEGASEGLSFTTKPIFNIPPILFPKPVLTPVPIKIPPEIIRPPVTQRSPTPHDGQGAAPAVVEWRTANEGPQASLDVRLFNPSDREVIEVSLVAVVAPLDQTIERREVASLRLFPGEERVERVELYDVPGLHPYAALPVEIEAHIKRKDGTIAMVPTPEPLYVRLADDSSKLAYVALPEAVAQHFDAQSAESIEGLLRTVSDANERIFDKRVPVELYGKGDGYHLGGSVVMKGDGIKWDHLYELIKYWPPILFAGPQDFRICSTWRASYKDAGFGEDYLKGVGLQDAPARFARGMITTAPGNKLVWQGQLDARGCMPEYVHLDPGNYTFIQEARLWKANGSGGTTIDVHFKKEGGTTYGEWLLTGFTTTATTESHVVNLHPVTHDHITRAAAVMSQIMNTSDLGLRPITYEVHANQGCPSFGGYESCASGNELYLGPPSPEQIKYQPYHDNFLKYVVAHEFGHILQESAMGLPHYDYDQNAAQTLCRCDHVVSANNLHCLQSRELTGAAQIEGFAQFFASRVFNSPAGSDCTFVYYKEFKNPDGSVSSPPLARDCKAHVHWMENYCLAANAGTEQDWMNFLYNVNTVSANRTMMNDLANIYVSACGGSLCNWSDNAYWEQLRAAAQTYYGGPLDARYLHFVNTASSTGVNH